LSLRISVRLVRGWPARLSLPYRPPRRVATRTPRLAFRHLLVLRHRVVLHDLALEDPDLDPAGAVRREGRGYAVIDISAQCVQWHAALAIPFHACDLGAAQASRAIHANTARPNPPP